MVKRIPAFVSVIVTAIAVLTASSASIFWFYQPKIPKLLVK